MQSTACQALSSSQSPVEVRKIVATADSDMYLLTAGGDFWECIQTAWRFCSLLSGHKEV